MSIIKSGDIFPTNENETVKVIEYKNCHKIIVEHQDEFKYTRSVAAKELRNRAIKNPFRKSVCGVGYLGVGEHKATVKGKRTKAYTAWSSMLSRVHPTKTIEHYRTYENCSVEKDWYNFQNFADWFYQQPNWDKKGFQLDKDLIIIGNKHYGPKTCSLLPSQINSLLIDSKNIRGDLPMGVSKLGEKYQAHVKQKNYLKHIGTYSTVEEARVCYIEAKKQQIKRTAEKYKDVIDSRVYHNLINWTGDAIKIKEK